MLSTQVGNWMWSSKLESNEPCGVKAGSLLQDVTRSKTPTVGIHVILNNP
jgi:hypothetical protein